MRQKAYYTAAEIINNLYTTGKEWQLPDGTEYIGLYHTYTTGEAYTGATWNSNTAVALTPFVVEPYVKKLYKTLNGNIQTKYETVPNTATITITEQDRQRGFIVRYFVRKVNEIAITEIDKLQYDDWNNKKIDTNLYTAVKLNWYISGPIEDVKTVAVFTKGVISKNLQELKQAEQTMPGISSKLNNPTQYYADADFIVPKDINA